MSQEKPHEDGPDEHPTLEIPVVKREQEHIPSIGHATKSSLFHPKRNEDAFLSEPKRDLYSVFDGVGGSGLGEAAAQAALTALTPAQLEHHLTIARTDRERAHAKRMVRVFTTGGEKVTFYRGEVEGAMRDLIWFLNDRIETEAQSMKPRERTTEEALNGMGTTVTLCKEWKREDGTRFVTIGNCGDSRAYVFRNGSLIRLTKDQSYIRYLVDAGLIKDDQDVTQSITYHDVQHAADKRPELHSLAMDMHEKGVEEISLREIRHIILQYAGIATDMQEREGRVFSPEISTHEVFPGDVLIVTTDGIHDNVKDEKIQELARRFAKDPQGLADALLDAADGISLAGKEESKPDDMTVVVKKIL